jgi:hypothetical protein
MSFLSFEDTASKIRNWELGIAARPTRSVGGSAVSEEQSVFAHLESR